MSGRENDVNVKFRVSSGQMKKLFQQMQRLNNKVKQISKSMTKMNNAFKGLSSRFSTTNGKVSKLNKSFKNQRDRVDRVRKSLSKLNSKLNQTNRANKKVAGSTKKAGEGLGFTGLAFGFMGGTAAFAANQIRSTFMRTLEDMTGLLSEINRASLFSDTGISNGVVNLDGFNDKLSQSTMLAQKFGIPLEEVPTLLKDVEKAVPSDINTEMFAETIARFRLLENEVNVSQLSSDFATIQANFPDLPFDELADGAFAFSKSTKLGFNASIKSLGFAAQAAQRLNTDYNELLRSMSAVVAATPGERGTAGRGVRRVVSGLIDPKVLGFLKSQNVQIVDAKGNFLGLEKALGNIGTRYKQLRSQNELMGEMFLEQIGFTENAKLAFLSYVNTSEDRIKSLEDEFNSYTGNFIAASDNQAKAAEESFTRIKNAVEILKLQFVNGLSPALADLSKAFQEFLDDKEFVEVIKTLGKEIGQNLVGMAKAVIPLLKIFGNILKDNAPLVKALAFAMVALTTALTGMSIIFPIIGGLFAMQFVMEKLAKRYVFFGKIVGIQNKILGAFSRTIGKVTGRMTALFSRVGHAMFRGLTGIVSRIIPIFVKIAVKAGLFFGMAFNIFANAVIGAGAWIKKLGIKLAGIFTGQGAASGGAFGTAWTTVSNAIMSAGAWFNNILIKLGIKSGTGGAASGGLFGAAWITAASAVMRGLKWLQTVFTRIGVRSGLWGGTSGGLFGAAWVTMSSTIMRAKGWLVKTFTSIGIASGTAGTIAGRAFGAAFAIAVGVALAAVSVGIIDLINERLGGGSLLRQLGQKVGLDIPSASDLLGIGPGFDTRLRQLHPDLSDEELREKVRQGKLQGEFGGTPGVLPGHAIGGVGDSNMLIPEGMRQKMNEALGVQAENIVTENELIEEKIKLNKKGNTGLTSNNDFIAHSNELLPALNKLDIELIKKVSSQIIEIARNINIMSGMTTMIAEVNVMWANVIAQGNRAAGKLASLWVDSDGNWHMNDPGVSSGDANRIATNEQIRDRTRDNQVSINVDLLKTQVKSFINAVGKTGQTNEININSEINIENANDLDAEQIRDIINTEFTGVMKKELGALVQ